MRKLLLAATFAAATALAPTLPAGAAADPPTDACHFGTMTAHENIPHNDNAPGTHVAHETVPHC
jgi:hypothetical protein